MSDAIVVRAVLTAALLLVGCDPGLAPPPTRVDSVTDVYHGREFTDDYRWLEQQDTQETRAWIAAQNSYAEQVIGESPIRDRFRARLRELVDRDDVGSTRKAGAFEYFTMRRSGEEVEIIYRRPVPEAGDSSKPSAEREYEIVLDPSTVDPTHRTPLEIVGFSPDGRLMLYAIRQGGADETEVRIRDLESGEDLADRLPDALYQGIEFDSAGTGFYYTHRSRVEGPRIRHHTLGEDPAADEEIWGEGYGPTSYIGMDIVAAGDRIFTVQHGWARNDLFIQRATGPLRRERILSAQAPIPSAGTRIPLGGGRSSVQPLVEGVDAHFRHRVHDGRLYVLTDWEASNYRLLVADLDDPTSDAWRVVLPESQDVLEDYAFIDGKIYATYLQDVAHRVRVFAMDGTPAGELEVPENSSVEIRAGEPGKAVLTVSGYLTPSTEYEVDLATGQREVTEPPEIDVDPSKYEVTKIRYRSQGGVEAPVYVLHQAGIELDGSHPTILNGYGGFNSSIRPGFSATRLAWLDAGGVYAVATLRGGAEFGEDWHRDGMLQNKQHVFDDFIAAAERLIELGFTRSDRLGISGGSNGGLLVASVMTQRPDLFRAVLCTYPDLDMVRFFEFSETNNIPALLEYGDARIPEHFEAIVQYSPYQAVRDGVRYPAVMLATGDLDTRVPPLQARKMTARLQAATGSGRPVVLWYDLRGGHAAGRGRPMSQLVEDSARELTFLAQELGLGESGDG